MTDRPVLRLVKPEDRVAPDCEPEHSPLMVNRNLTLWCEWMTGGGMSIRTITERLRIMQTVERFTEGDAGALTADQLTAWLATLFIKKSSRRSYIAALRSFYRWQILTDRRADDPTIKLARVRVARGVPRPISTDQLAQALRSGRFYSRTRTMIILAASEGLRASEIAGMRGEYIRGDSLRVIGKGDTDKILPLHALVAAEAVNYPRIGWWFTSPSDRSQPITGKNVSNVVGKALRRAGIPASCHQIRHWFGTESLRASGGDIRLVQELMRHANIASTAIYTQIDDEDRRRVLTSLPVPERTLHVI